MKKRTLLLALLLFAPKIFGGGGFGGGGTPPAIEAPNELMLSMKSGTLNGDLIRYTEPGTDPVYLRPDPLSIKERSLTAKTLPSGEKTVFYVPSEGQTIQNKIGIDFARVLRMNSAPGVLPLLPLEIVTKPKPSIEVVKIHEIDAETAEKIFSNESGSSTGANEDSTN